MRGVCGLRTIYQAAQTRMVTLRMVKEGVLSQHAVRRGKEGGGQGLQEADTMQRGPQGSGKAARGSNLFL